MKKRKPIKTFDEQMSEFENSILAGTDGTEFNVEPGFMERMIKRYHILARMAREVQRVLRESHNGADANALLADLHMKYRAWALETREVEG